MVHLLALASCTKNRTNLQTSIPPHRSVTTPPSIIGKWTLKNISGVVINNSSNNLVDTTTYTFDSTTNTITATDYRYNSNFNPPSTQYTVGTYQITTEVWTFNENGTYSINESYIQHVPSSDKTIINSCTGIWEYLSNTQINNGFILTGGISSILSFNQYNGGTYAIQTINDSTMTLAFNYTQTANSGYVYNTNITIAFGKQ